MTFCFSGSLLQANFSIVSLFFLFDTLLFVANNFFLSSSSHPESQLHSGNGVLRLRNDLYCVGWGVKLYSLTHSAATATACMVYVQWYTVYTGWTKLAHLHFKKLTTGTNVLIV